jgi:hypothetical protein
MGQMGEEEKIKSQVSSFKFQESLPLRMQRTQNLERHFNIIVGGAPPTKDFLFLET